MIASLCLATDLGMGFPLEHGLHSTLVAARLGERLGIDPPTAAQTYYGCLLFYAGCTADAEIAADLFDTGALLRHFTPVVFGSRAQTMAGILRALASQDRALPARALQVAGKLPRAASRTSAPHRRHVRGRADAQRPARHARLGAGPVRPLHRALGRQGRAGRPPRGRDPARRCGSSRWLGTRRSNTCSAARSSPYGCSGSGPAARSTR